MKSRKFVQIAISLVALPGIASLRAEETEAIAPDRDKPNAEYAANAAAMENPAPVVRKNLVKSAMTDEKILWRPLIDGYDSMHLRITGPGIEPYEETFAEGQELSFAFYDDKSAIWSDGLYAWELSASPKISAKNRELMAAARNETGVDNIEELLRENGVMPAVPAGQSMTQAGTFRILEGQVVRLQTEFQRRLEEDRAEKAEAAGFAPDVDQVDGDVQLRHFIGVVGNNSIDGSLCVGFDCVAEEPFGFDTIRLKENNLRLDFQDTSIAAAFPPNDWRIIINDSANGGANHFSVEDRSAGNQVFRVFAGARNNALVVDSQGDVGLGTASPATDIDIKTGNTPTVRLQQDGTSGFTPQTWDLAGNESNFFVRDATNGSTLPFRIRPGAPTDSIFIEGGTAPEEGSIGIGTASPDARVHIDTESGQTEPSLLIDNDSGSGPDDPFVVTADGLVGIGTDSPSAELTISDAANTGTSIHLLGAPPGQFHLLSADNAVGGTGDGRLDIQGTNINMNFNVDADITMVAGTSTGEVGIGTTGPGFKLEVNGTAGKPGGGSWSVASDERLKKNIQQLDGALDKLTSLRGVTFEYRDPDAIRQLPGERMGLIAQEVEQVFPDWIDEGKDGFKRLTVRGFEAVAANAMRELRAEKDTEIATLRDEKNAQISALREKTATLEAQMKALLERMEALQENPGERSSEE